MPKWIKLKFESCETFSEFKADERSFLPQPVNINKILTGKWPYSIHLLFFVKILKRAEIINVPSLNHIIKV